MRLLKAEGNFEIPGCYRPRGFAAGSTAAAASPVLAYGAGVYQDLSQLPADERDARKPSESATRKTCLLRNLRHLDPDRTFPQQRLE